MYNTTNKFIILLLAVFLLWKAFPIIEHAAGSPGALVQLATSSVNTLPYAYSPWYRPTHHYHHKNRPSDINYNNYNNANNANNQLMDILPWLLSGVVLWKFLL